MKLARIFQDYMILQRRKPILIWGISEKPEHIEVKINDKKIMETEIPRGKFSFQIPAQEAAEDVKLQIGSLIFSHVDIGEVWIAGGQSNMEFKLKHTVDGEAEIQTADDEHLRIYTVGQYSFDGEREEGYKAWNPWDRWFPYQTEYAADFSAVAVYFAKELRTSGVPVGILNCNWGGTSAASWLDREYLETDSELKWYINEFETMTAKLDLEQYYAIKKAIRPVLASPETRANMDNMLKYTLRPQDMGQMLHTMSAGQSNNDIPIEMLMAVGPGEPTEPGKLYEHMVKEIIGYTVQGVIWYQGESDDKKPELYEKLFTALIDCWRTEWKNRNSGMEGLPFLFVQLAPFGTWMNNSGKNFPILRAQQEAVSKHVEDTWMTSISDKGNVFDIHPKEKKEAGIRLAYLAEKYIYGQNIAAEAPEAQQIDWEKNNLRISFKNGKGLYIEQKEFTSYNGFKTEEIPTELLPPITDGVNGLQIWADESEVKDAVCWIELDRLIICSELFEKVSRVRIEFAQTGFYQINLYNSTGIPAKPFVLEIER